MSDDDFSTCGMCGVDPIEHENTSIGVTIMNLCEECYQTFISITEESIDYSQTIVKAC